MLRRAAHGVVAGRAPGPPGLDGTALAPVSQDGVHRAGRRLTRDLRSRRSRPAGSRRAATSVVTDMTCARHQAGAGPTF